MEENYRPENQPAPGVSEVTVSCVNELTRSNSDLPSLIAENYEDVIRGSANATPVFLQFLLSFSEYAGSTCQFSLFLKFPWLDRGLDEENKGDSCSGEGRKNDFLMDDCKAWTNEKHNLYLNHLEVSFVKQLNQSMGFLAQCSKQNKSENSVSQNRASSVHNASKQLSISW
ncbi:uncharacterized protein LOC111381192 isoform X3 [Olea europaea var. sylvestris]|uniref:uncharacterized protein LOC111381192 isoform X3 n=1 Tax=Olea europaea var. sylvestris TaxID=158386 RepID=UPI000C1D2579|nr:uncharacterized protein LOC111381192 isoform X3 [Olea europaea var. sylvestris]